MDEYYYSGSEFYAEDDARINSAFTDDSEQPRLLADCVTLSARRYGQWWTLTGVPADCAEPAVAQQRLRRRYSLIVTLNHPNVTRAVAMIQTPLLPDECIIEEFIDGQSLSDFLSKGQHDAKLRHKLLEQIVDALQYCHRKDVVHGNLSVHTIMVTHQEHDAKLVAFACEGQPQDDIRALGDIIDALQLPRLKSLAERCRSGQMNDISEVLTAINKPTPYHWGLKGLLMVVTAIIVLAGAFMAGHYMTLSREQKQADSLPLPGIYFTDTVQLPISSDMERYTMYRSSVTGANMYYLDDINSAPGNISENVAVDLGLSVLWAPFNVGCGDTRVNSMGSLYTWCDTLGAGAYVPIDKYWPESRTMIDIAGTNYDSSRRLWGGRWRMPTIAEWQELVTRCKWTLVLERGIAPGYKVHGPSGAEIFLPLAGYQLRFRAYNISTAGHYWSSTPADGVDRRAHAVRLDTAAIDVEDVVSIAHSQSVRPVLDKK